MVQIRRGVFETNSSSTHSITMCTGDDFDKWRRGELLFVKDVWGSTSEYVTNDFVTMEQAKDILAKCEDYEGDDPASFTLEEFMDACKNADISICTFKNWGDDYQEYYESEFVTPSGERVVAFGQYGSDG